MTNYLGRKPASTYVQPSFVNYPKINYDTAKIKRLFQLVQGNDVDDLKSYIDDNKLTWSVVSDDEQTLLHAVLDNELDTHTEKENIGKLLMVKYLIAQGVNIDHSNLFGITPLHLAVGQQNNDIVKILLDMRANVDALDNHSMTPIHYAVIGFKKKAEPIRKIKSIITDNQENKKINNVYLDKIVDIIVDKLRDTPQLSYFTNILQHYNKFNEEYYNKTMIDGFMNKIVDIMSKYTGTNEFQRKKEFENAVNGIKKEVEAKMREQINDLITTNNEFSQEIFTDYTKDAKRSDMDTYNFSKKYLKNEILKYDRKIYDSNLELYNKVQQNTQTNLGKLMYQIKELYDYYGKIIGQEIDINNILLFMPDDYDDLDPTKPFGPFINDTNKAYYQKYVELLNNIYNIFIDFYESDGKIRDMLIPKEIITDSLTLNVMRNDAGDRILGKRIYELELYRGSNGEKYIGKIIFNIPAVLYDGEPIAETLKNNYFINLEPSLVIAAGGVPVVGNKLREAAKPAAPPNLPNIEAYFRNSVCLNPHYATAFEFFKNNKYLHDPDDDAKNDDNEELFNKPLLFVPNLVNMSDDGINFYDNENYRFDIDENTNNKYRIRLESKIRQVAPPDIRPIAINYCELWYKQPNIRIPCYDNFIEIEQRYKQRIEDYFGIVAAGPLTQAMIDARKAILRANGEMTKDEKKAWLPLKNVGAHPGPCEDHKETNRILDDVYFKVPNETDKYLKFNTHVVQMGELHNRVGFARGTSMFSSSNLLCENIVKIERKVLDDANYTRYDFYSELQNLNSLMDNSIDVIKKYIEDDDNGLDKILHKSSNILKPTKKTFENLIGIYETYKNNIKNIYDEFSKFPPMFNKLDSMKLVYRNLFISEDDEKKNLKEYSPIRGALPPLKYYADEKEEDYDFIFRIMRYCNYIIEPNTPVDEYQGNTADKVTNNVLLKQNRKEILHPNKLDTSYINTLTTNSNIPFVIRLSVFYDNIPELNREIKNVVEGFNNEKQFGSAVIYNKPENYWFQYKKKDELKDDKKYPSIMVNSYGENIKATKLLLFNELMKVIKNDPDYKKLLGFYMMQNVINGVDRDSNSNSVQIIQLYDTMIYKIMESILQKHYSMILEYASNRLIRQKFFNYFKKEWDGTGPPGSESKFIFDNNKDNATELFTIFDDGFPAGKNYIIGIEKPLKTSLNIIKDFDKSVTRLINNVDLKEFMMLTENATKVAQEYIYNINYSNDIPIYEKRQIIIDMKIIINLLKRDANVSIKNQDDNLPIHLAIESLNTEVVKVLLIKNSRLHGEKSKNKKGLTPYKYNLVLFKNHLDVLYQDMNLKSSKFVMAINKGFIKMMYDKFDNKNNIPVFIEQALPTAILIFNMYLYFNVFTKPKENWEYADQKKFVETINKYTNCKASYPYFKLGLLNLTDDNISLLGDANSFINNNSIANTYMEFENELSESRNTLTEKNKQIDIEIKSLQYELNDLILKDQLNNLDIIRRTAVNDKIIMLNADKKKNEDDIVVNNNNMNVVTTSKNANGKIYSETTIIDKIKKSLDRSYEASRTNNVLTMLGEVMDEFNEMHDYHTTVHPYNKQHPQKKNRDDYNRFYNSLWRNLIHQNNMFTNSLEFIHLHINEMLYKIVLTSKMEKIEKMNASEILELKSDLVIIQKFYKYNIINMIEKYQSTDSHYKENELLTNIVNIVTHIVDTIVTNNMYAMIVKIVSLAVFDTDGLDASPQISDKGREMVQGIIESIYQTYTVESFMSRDNFTLKLVKRILEIYEKDNDETENLNIQTYMEFVCSIISNNQVRPIPETGSIIQNIKKYIIPYYMNIFTILIPLIKQVIENYICYLCNEYKHINMLNTLIDAL
jgi:ankyrin repeat protein